MSLRIFNNLDSFWKYVEDTSGFSRTTQFNEWSKAMKEIQGSAKYSETFDQFGRYSGVIDESVKENYVGVGKNVNTSSGVKSAPTMESVYTESGSASTVKTAVKTETAKGLQTRGPIGMTPIMNVVSAIAAAMGLYHIGITVSNWHSWRDMFNDVFDANLGEDADFSDVVDFGKSRIQLYFTGVDDYTATYVPYHIVQKLYTYFARNMVSVGTGVTDYYDAGMFAGLPLFVRIEEDGFYYRLASVPTSSALYNVRYVEFSDALLENHMTDYISQLIGAGYIIAPSVSDFLITNMLGIYNEIRDASSGAQQVLEASNRVDVAINFNRSSGIPKTQPISANEINLTIQIYNDADLVIDPEGKTLQIQLSEDTIRGCKGLKPGRTGGETAYDNYSYLISTTYTSERRTDILQTDITFPASERHVATYLFSNQPLPNRYGMGGWSFDYDNQPYIQTGGLLRCSYSNFSYTGGANNYEPDEDLLRAGWQKRSTTDKVPTPNTTLQEGYTEWFHKRQQVAQPDKNNNNTDSYYMPTTVPNGMNNANDITENGYNPNGQNQNYIQSGRMPDTTNIDDVNDDIGEAVEQYNKSDITIDSAPNPIPETEPNPQYPETPPTEPDGDSGDTPTAPSIGGVTASGMVSVYNPTKQQLKDFSAWLWSSNFLDNFLKIFANPMDAIIGLHIMYATPISSGSEHIIAGYLDSEVSSKVVTQQYSKLDCGTITIPEFYGNATDYEPYTTIHIYLPFIGIVPLKANDVLGKQLHLEYGIDALTGTCLATLTTIKGDSQIACYTFAGNCAVQIPVSGGNYAQMITGLAGFIGAGAGAIVTGNPIMALGAGASFMNGNVNVQHSGSIGSNAGACGIRTPYVIITRKIAFNAENYQHFYGLPANKHVKLSMCKGYTQVKSCHVESIYRATDNEKQEIESLLKDGIIII